MVLSWPQRKWKFLLIVCLGNFYKETDVDICSASKSMTNACPDHAPVNSNRRACGSGATTNNDASDSFIGFGNNVNESTTSCGGALV